MTSEGFGRLTSALMERGTKRVHAVIGNDKGPARQAEPAKRRPVERSGGASNSAPVKPAISENDTAVNGQSFAGTDSKGTAIKHTSQAPLKESRRASSGSTVMIEQPPSGDMSEVTVSMWGVESESQDTAEPTKGGQRPTSVTYKRRTVLEHDSAKASGKPDQKVWVDTPTFSGPDRRHDMVSPEVERRKSVPPRLKAGVRLEQERYLRLKLASMETKRTQQDLITSALDAYLNQIGIDRFVRVAMGFGGAETSSEAEREKANL